MMLKRFLVALVIIALWLLTIGVGAALGEVSQTVRYGDENLAVAAVQQRLDEYGYTIDVDGKFGIQTLRAVKSWQRSNGLNPDGVVGSVTLRSLGLLGQAKHAAPASPPPPKTIEEIIRSEWPDELEDHAVQIAFRESRFVPTAHNYCCHGLFQIYWTIHRGWLAALGIDSVDDLYDPVLNARAAYALYQRANGWGPWSQTA